ncbi:hypothetical protein D3C81_2085770 [compost metagenome]
MCDDGVRHTVASGQPFDETGFANRVLRVPFGLDVYRLHDVMGTSVGEVVIGKIAAFNRAVVTVAKRDVGLGREPRMVVDRGVPEMVMGIYDGAVPQLRHDAPHPG